jgi:hypothetical protein
MVKDSFAFVGADTSPAEFIEAFRDFYGPTMNAYDAARGSGTEDELEEQLVRLAEGQNTGAGGGTSIAATFLRVTVSL